MWENEFSLAPTLQLPAKIISKNLQSRYSHKSYSSESSMGSNFLAAQGFSDDLCEVSEHNEDCLFSTLQNRLEAGVNYTFAGPVLLCASFPQKLTQEIRDNYSKDKDLPPHLFSVTAKAYQTLKQTKQAQALALMGPSGTGKTFAAVHLVDHLLFMSTEESIKQDLFKSIHSALKLVHTMGSVYFDQNKEGTCSGMSLKVVFDSEFRAMGCVIHANLLDSFPKTETKRTYHVLHALFGAAKVQLSSLGLNLQPSYEVFNHQPTHSLSDVEVYKHFTECLKTLGFSRQETQSVFEVLASVILVLEISYVGENFVAAGGSEKPKWTPRHRFAIQKVCKHLKLHEAKFTEIFGEFSSKSQAEAATEELAKVLYESTFDWLVTKVNEKLEVQSDSIVKKRFSQLKFNSKNWKTQKKLALESFKGKHFISIVDFPGFRENSTLGGFCTNLAAECLSFVSENNYLKLLTALAVERVKIDSLDMNKSRYIVDLLLGSKDGVLKNLTKENFPTYWKTLKKDIEDHEFYREVMLFNKSKFTVKHSFGEVEYNVTKLREKASLFKNRKVVYKLLSHCSHPALGHKLKKNPPLNLFDSLNQKISNLLSHVLSLKCHLVYFLSAPQNALDYSYTLSSLRNTLVLPLLIWKWYGYHYWVNLEDLVVNFYEETKLDLLLKQLLGEADYYKGTRYLLLKKPGFHKLIQKAKFFADRLNLDFVNKLYSKVSRPCREGLFEYTLLGEKLNVSEPNLKDYLLPEFSVETSFQHSKLTNTRRRRHTENLVYCPQPLETQNLVVCSDKKLYHTIKKVATNLKNLNYTHTTKVITKIQACWRGFKARKYYKAYKRLKSHATTIQRVWKGYKCRKVTELESTKKAIVLIQRSVLKWLLKRQRAAKKIQKWYRKVLEKEKFYSFSYYSKVSRDSSPFLHTSKRSTERTRAKSEISFEEQLSFSPSILDSSRKLAEKKRIKQGCHHYSMFERFNLLEKHRTQRIKDSRQEKLLKEESNYSFSPAINNTRTFSQNFLQRQEAAVRKYKARREKRILEKTYKETKEVRVPVKPRTKSFDQTVDSLFVWAKHKQLKLQNSQNSQQEKQAFFKPNSLSTKILERRKSRINQSMVLLETQKKNTAPYWPKCK